MEFIFNYKQYETQKEITIYTTHHATIENVILKLI